MKRIQDIEKLSAEDLLQIGADESIPVPAGWKVKLPGRTTGLPRWSIAAAAAVLVSLGWLGLNRARQPKDSFDDPYLAYAAVEQALSRVGGNIHAAAGKVAESEMLLDKVNYWK